MSILEGIGAGTVGQKPAVAQQSTTRIPIGELALPLFDYQQEAAEHAVRDTGGGTYSLLALDMGLGKSPTGLAIAKGCRIVRPNTPVLIIVPPSLRFNWQREVAKFWPEADVETLQGTKPPAHWTPPAVDILLMGDSQISGWASTLAGQVHDMIVDESHRLKNPKAARTKGVIQVADAAEGARVLMTGTPMPNGRHGELAAQVTILGREAWSDLGGKGTFYTHYAPVLDTRFGTRASHNGAELHEALTNSFMFRRRRDDVIDLPAKGRTGLSVEASRTAARHYKRMEDDLITYLQEEGGNWKGAERAEALVKLGKLRHQAGLCKVEGIARTTAEMLMDGGDDEGVLIFAEHTDVIDALFNIFRKANLNPTKVVGGMSDKQKATQIDAFTDGNSRVMIGQITAAGVGLTLHGGGRNHKVIVGQLPWTPAEMRQAEDRLHRIGQTHDVEVIIALCAMDGTWTVDERLWGTLEGKHELTNVAIDGGEDDPLLEATQDAVLGSYR